MASVARLISVHKASYSEDSTYAGTFIALWKVLEITFGVICGCLPAVKPIIKPLLPKALSSSKRSRSITDAPYGTSSFGKREGERFHPYEDVDLQPMTHPHTSGIILKKTTTSIIGGTKQASDSEEHIIETYERH